MVLLIDGRVAVDRLKESVWFEIFKVGTWNGLEYSKDDLDKMVENFEKGDPRVPLIIGHNSFWGGEEKPAHGWVEKLKRSGKRLMAKARDVSAELVTAVNDEVYPMRSIEVWRDYNGRGVALGAIAFLGGSNPAVGGMADFQFEREKEGRMCFSYSSDTRLDADEGDHKLQYHQNGGGDDMTKEEMDKAIAKAIADATPNIVAQFKAGDEFTALETANKKMAEDLEATRNQAAAFALQADVEKCQAFAKGLLKDKKITPAHFENGMGAFLASLDNSAKFEFSKGKEQTRREFAMEMFSALPGNTSLFSQVDNSQPETSEISGEIEAFAKKHGLDPKLVAEKFAAQRRGTVGSVRDDDGEAGVAGTSTSLTEA